MIFEKQCRCCGLTKPVAEFNTRKGSKDGFRNECKACKSEIDLRYRLANAEKCKQNHAAYYASNKEVISKKHKEYYELNKESITARNKEYFEANREHLEQTRKEWYTKNKDRCKARMKLYNEVNKEHLSAKSKEYYLANKEKISKYLKEYCTKNAKALSRQKSTWRAANRGRISMLRHKYEQRLKRATPHWLTAEDISCMEDMYTAARMFKEYTGIDYDVDHVVPLQGKTVCGLNVPWNLAILEQSANRRKGNRYWPDMPEPE